MLGTCKYLGLPSMIGMSKKLATFKYVKDQIWDKINSWSDQCLSQEGKEVLIKFVLQSIPSYVWWVYSTTNSTGLHWLSLERLVTPKVFGGMGFKSLKTFTMAMVGKKAWKLISNPTALIT